MDFPEVKRHEKLELFAQDTAILIVDMINDFFPGGELPVPGIVSTVDAIHKLCFKSNFFDGKFEYFPLLRFLNDKHQPGDPEFAFFPPHAAYPKGRELYPRLQTTPGYKPDQIINKTTFDGFFATILDKTLRQFNIKTVIVVGTVSNICVLATAQSARLLGYNVIIPEDCISSLSPLGHAILLHQVQTVLGGQIVAKAEDITFELRK